MYFPIALWPWTEKKAVSWLKQFGWIPIAAIIMFTGTYAISSTKRMVTEIRNPLPILEYLKPLGIALGEKEPDKSQKIAARKPNVAHYAGLTPFMFPDDVETVEDLVDFCRKYRVRYVLYSEVEYNFRPSLRVLVVPGKDHPGLERILTNMGGIVFRVKGL
jgi:hypothetical protein